MAPWPGEHPTSKQVEENRDLVIPRSGKLSLWPLWLGLLAVSAFGPLLDVATGQPINWLFGLLVLVALVLLAAPRVLMGRARILEWIRRGVSEQPVGLALSAYILFFLLQALRPDTNTINTLLALRWPLLGAAAYWMTAILLTEPETRESRIRDFLLMVTVVTAIVAIYGLFQYAVGLEQLKEWGLAPADARLVKQGNFRGGEEIFRIFGPLRRNEAMGAFMVLGLSGAFVAFLQRVGPRWLTLGTLLVGLTALVLAMSLTSIGTFFIWIALIFLFMPASRKLLMGPIMLLLVGPLVLNAALDGLVVARVQGHLNQARAGTGRLEETQDWIAEMGDRSLDRQLLGTGVCTGINLSTLNRVGTMFQRIGIEIEEDELFDCGWQREIQDTWYGTMSLEIGWIGVLLFWLPFGLLAFWQLPRLRHRPSDGTRRIQLALALAALAFWPSGWVGALIAYMPVTAYFWSFVALAQSGSGEPAIPEPRPLDAK